MCGFRAGRSVRCRARRPQGALPRGALDRGGCDVKKSSHAGAYADHERLHRQPGLPRQRRHHPDARRRRGVPRRPRDGRGWQFPQGGVQRNERPEEALFRELHEEVGPRARRRRAAGQHARWLRYRLPRQYVRRRGHPCASARSSAGSCCAWSAARRGCGSMRPPSPNSTAALGRLLVARPRSHLFQARRVCARAAGTRRAGVCRRAAAPSRMVVRGSAAPAANRCPATGGGARPRSPPRGDNDASARATGRNGDVIPLASGRMAWVIAAIVAVLRCARGWFGHAGAGARPGTTPRRKHRAPRSWRASSKRSKSRERRACTPRWRNSRWPAGSTATPTGRSSARSATCSRSWPGKSDDLAFYRSIVSPADGIQGLRIQRFEVLPGERSRGSRAPKLTLVQAMRHESVVRASRRSTERHAGRRAGPVHRWRAASGGPGRNCRSRSGISRRSSRPSCCRKASSLTRRTSGCTRASCARPVQQAFPWKPAGTAAL